MSGAGQGDRDADLRSFGRKRGRKPSARQQRLIAELLPRVRLDMTDPPPVPLVGMFEPPCGRGCIRDVWLEIGFGGAEHLAWQAKHNPGIGHIGCEPFVDGVIKALAAIGDEAIANIKVHDDDARPVLRWLPSGSIGRAFILFPDPWPKRRHAKRRLVSPPVLDLLARALRPGAELRIATDIGEYARSSLLALSGRRDFAWNAAGPEDWRCRPADWPATRYEEKARAQGRRCYFLTYVRT